MQKIIFAIICVSLPIASGWGEKSVYKCVRIDDVVLDGVINDTAWRQVAWSRPFLKLGSNRPAVQMTRYKCGYNDDGIYIAVECSESDVSTILADCHDLDNLWDDDSVEFFIKQKNTEQYFHLIVNSKNKRYNTLRTASKFVTPSILWEWKSSSKILENKWVVEIFIPFSVVERYPSADDLIWDFNICRSDPGMKSEYSTWARMQHRFHEPEYFGRLVFAEQLSQAAGDKNIAKIQNTKNLAYLKNIKKLWEKKLNYWNGSSDKFYSDFLNLYSKEIDCFNSRLKNIDVTKHHAIVQAEKKLCHIAELAKQYDLDLSKKLLHNLFVKQ